MRSTAIRVAAATALAALLTLAPAAPAAVASATTCVTGAVTGYAGDLTADGLRRVTVAGWAQPCPGSAATTFSLTRYYLDAGQHERRQLTSADAPTPFTLTVTLDDPRLVVTPEERYGPLGAICLAGGLWTPLSCVGVDSIVQGAPPAVRALPVDASVIRCVPRVYDRHVPVVNPTCGNCV